MRAYGNAGSQTRRDLFIADVNECLLLDIALRWTTTGMLEAEQQLRRVIGYRNLAKIALLKMRRLARSSVGPGSARKLIGQPSTS